MRYYGQVKWFKDNKGYGFVTVLGRCDGAQCNDDDHPPTGKEIFVHHTDIQPSMSTYKTLMKGEYVSFSLKRVTRPRGALDAADVQASDVRGAYGGALMCDGINVGAITRNMDANAPIVMHNGDIMFAPGDDVIL